MRLGRRSLEVAGRTKISELTEAERARHELVVRRSAMVIQAAKLRPTTELPALT